MYDGYYHDAETGLEFVNARYYSSDLGRFIARDPIGYEAGSLSLYQYVEGSPIGFTDPLGLESEEQCEYNCLRSNPEYGGMLRACLKGCKNKGPATSCKDDGKTPGKNVEGDGCKPISITLTPVGTKVHVGSVHNPTNPASPYPSPFLGYGKPGARPTLGNTVGISHANGIRHFNFEIVIEFNTDPMFCKWGRQILGRFGGGWSEDDPDWDSDYIIGHKVYMYDNPELTRFTTRRVFNVWAASADMSNMMVKKFIVKSDGTFVEK
jgi:RHS repeat-associated protein